MKEKITALISFIASVVGILGIIYFFYDNHISHYDASGEDLLYMFLLMVIFLSTFLYIIWTKFGKKGSTELEQIESENQLLRKKIERQELLKKLEK